MFISLALLVGVPPLLAQEEGLIATMDEMRFRPPREKGTADLVEGKVGKAVRFHFDKDARSTFFTSNIHGTPEWDRAAGFSFWVKGDGTDGFGGLQFIYDDDYAVRYDLCFPVKGTEWTKVTVAWQDLIPVLPGPRAKPLGDARRQPAVEALRALVRQVVVLGRLPGAHLRRRRDPPGADDRPGRERPPPRGPAARRGCSRSSRRASPSPS